MVARGRYKNKYSLLLTVLTVSVFIFIPGTKIVGAAQITQRSLTLVGSTTIGGSDPGGVVNDNFNFTVPTSAAIQSIGFLYCTTASGTCTTPTGLVTTSSTLGTTSSGLSGFTLTNTISGNPYISSASSYTPPSSTALNVVINSITNPSQSNYTFFVRITTYSGAAQGGSAIDAGTVAASTATPIVLSGTMPESLIFCTGGTIGETSGIPDCTKATSGAVSFTSLFSPTATSTATSQMSASTNASHGYTISVYGTTLTSGSSSIPEISTASASTVGTGQFGLNLVANTIPVVGSALTPVSDGINFKGEASTGFSTANSFLYTSGSQVADSAYSGTGPTDSQIYTVSYIVNVPGNQAAGTYTTTLTYICTATF